MMGYDEDSYGQQEEEGQGDSEKEQERQLLLLNEQQRFAYDKKMFAAQLK